MEHFPFCLTSVSLTSKNILHNICIASGKSRQASQFGAKGSNSPVAFLCSLMHICYVDESGTSDIPGTSSHFVLAGLAIPISEWKNSDIALNKILNKYDLARDEIHTAWILRKYIEQSQNSRFR